MERGSDVFISYARSTERQARVVEAALREAGFGVWRDDELPPHLPYADVIQERLAASKAVVVLWSSDAVRSQWVRAEADYARRAGALVQASLDASLPPLPFDQLHCAQLEDWSGDAGTLAWRKVVESVSALVGRTPPAPGAAAVGAHGLAQPPAERPSMAVLPFASLGPEAEDWFAEGVMEEVITALGRIRSIFVIGAGSSLSLKGRQIGVAEAARLFGVRYVLEGSVRRAGQRIRITVKLDDARDGGQIWADRFDGAMEDVFALQDQVALSVAGVIEPTVQAAELRRAARRPIESQGAYDLYLRAAALRATLERDQVLAAIDLLDRALALEPSFGPALGQLAGCHSLVFVNGWSDDPGGHRLAGLAMAERAIVSGADDAAVLAQTANALMELDNDTGRAGALSERAITLNPGCAYAWFVLGLVTLVGGDAQTAAGQFQEAARLDPLSRLGDMARVHMAAARSCQGEYAEAARLFRQTTHRTPRIQLILAMTLAHLGEVETGLVELARYEAATSVPPLTMVALMTRANAFGPAMREGIDTLLTARRPPDG